MQNFIALASGAIATVATLQTDSEKETGGKSYAIPHGVVIGMENGTDNMWIAGGTADEQSDILSLNSGKPGWYFELEEGMKVFSLTKYRNPLSGRPGALLPRLKARGIIDLC
jgi:hypothetical protein